MIPDAVTGLQPAGFTWIDLWRDITIPLFAAFGGTYFAFLLQQRHQAASDKARELAAGRMALLALLRQIRSVVATQHQFINPHRSNGSRHLAIKFSLPDNDDSYRVDVSGLAFLATARHAQVIDDLAMLTLRFLELQDLVHRRNELLSTVVRKLAAAGFSPGTPHDKNAVIAATGPIDHPLLVSFTDSYVKMTDELAKALPELAVRLHRALEERFPKDWIPKLGLAQPEATGSPDAPDRPRRPGD